VPIYEFRCRTCDERFEARRAMADADVPATCPQGHADTVRLLAAFAATGRAAAGPGGGSATPMGGGGCGGACACAH
jgi:putative FmdB family regulatory protein